MVEKALPQQTSNVQSVDRAFDVLNALSTQPFPQSALDISKKIGLHRTIVYRLLRTMAARHIVEKREGGRYVLGAAVMQLGTRYLDNLTLRRIALPHMIDLNAHGLAERSWHVTLGVPAPSQIVIVERVWDPKVSLESLLTFPVGMPLTRTAAGRAFLSQLTDEQTLDWVTPEECERLRGDLETVRAQDGLAFSVGELLPGAGAIAAPLLASPGSPIGTLIVSGPNIDGHFSVDSEIAQLIMRAAAAINNLLSAVSQ